MMQLSELLWHLGTKGILGLAEIMSYVFLVVTLALVGAFRIVCHCALLLPVIFITIIEKKPKSSLTLLVLVACLFRLRIILLEMDIPENPYLTQVHLAL